MRTTHRILLVAPAVAFVAACGGTDPDSALSADLQKDLELAKARSVELAMSASRSPVASTGLESVPRGTSAPAERAALPAPQRRRPPALVSVARRTGQPAAAPVPAAESAEAAAGAEPWTEPAPAGDEVAAAPEPAPEPVSGPELGTEGIGAGRPRDPGGWGTGTGTVGTGTRGGGVVVRGGDVGDDDHCQLHPRGVPIRIGGRGARGVPVYNPAPVYYPGTMTDGRQRAGGATIRSRGPAPMIGGTTAAPRVSEAPVASGGARRRN